jgi:hypothetical protein
LFTAITLNLRPSLTPRLNDKVGQARSLSKREGGQTVVLKYAFALTLHLSNKKSSVQECDANADEKIVEAGNKKIKNYKQKTDL